MALGVIAYIWSDFFAHDQDRKAYPNNHVYLALLAANAQVQAGKSHGDVTDEFRRATAGESFHQIIAEFKELGMNAWCTPTSPYVSGTEYGVCLQYRQLSKLSIPNSMFNAAFPPPEECCPDFEVRIKYNSDTDYLVLKAAVANNADML
jgi:hypothetical protein